MSFYILDNIYDTVIKTGFSTKEAAEDYIFQDSYMGQYWWYYDVKEWKENIAWGVIYSRDCLETGCSTFWIFETWDEAISFALDQKYDVVNNLIEDFDFEDDIFQIDMTKGE